MFKDLKKKTVIITGGNGFLGGQFVKAFLEKESNVLILDISKNKKKHPRLFYYKCDITNEASVARISKEIHKKFKKIDVLINNAAIDHLPNQKNNSNKLEDFALDKWNNEINVGLTGSLNCTKYFGKLMAKQKNGGVILNISSDLGIIAPNQKIYRKLNFVKPVTYSVIKHGIIGMTKYAAFYWGKKNVRCNALAPGGINRSFNKSFVNKIKKLIPLNRMAKINEYNNIVLFLCSDDSSYITGTTIISDGGRTII